MYVYIYTHRNSRKPTKMMVLVVHGLLHWGPDLGSWGARTGAAPESHEGSLGEVGTSASGFGPDFRM